MNDKAQQPIIKKVKKVSGHGHHGGAWKIAYADFVTAMMAFFLLMWLLNATSEEQKRGIANYFDPMSSTAKGGGNMGVMGGSSVKETEGSLSDAKNRITLKPTPAAEKGAGGSSAGVTQNPDPNASDNGGMTEDEKKASAEKAVAQQEIKEKLMKENKSDDFKSKAEEEKALEGVEQNIKQTIEKMPELKDLNENIKIEMTPEGLRIQIIDQTKNSMFPSGSSRMYKQMEDILKSVGTAIKGVPNKVQITGHTDGNQFNKNSIFTNWELSAERANASRRVLAQNGVDDFRFSEVIGKADRELLVPKEPQASQNRRISITLLRQIKE